MGGKTKILVAVAVMALSVGAAAGPVAAKKFSGTKKGEKIAGTKKADKINGKAGNDKLKGKGGNDVLNGGKGRDKITGGAGADKHIGGAGNDVLKAADNRRDKAINGGAGRDRCVIDSTLELSLVRGCETVTAGGPGAGGPGPGPGPGEGLRVNEFTGLVGCAQQALPLCVFTISGDGADAPVGLVTGGDGVTLGLGVSVAITGPEWTAIGLYACTADGYIRVTIGSEVVDVPVDCAV